VADTFIETPAEKTDNRQQLIAAIILGLAATLTAIASYMSAVVDGDAQVARAASGRSLSDANFFYSQADQISGGDQALFVAYAGAYQQDNQALADYYQTLMRPEMADAIDWWQKTDDAETPFDTIDGNPYTIDQYDSADEMQKKSEGEVKDAEDADAKGDKYDLSTVLLALTLFFAGVATLFSNLKVTSALLAVGGVTLLLGFGVFLQGLTL
jgi:hypothetical protein